MRKRVDETKTIEYGEDVMSTIANTTKRGRKTGTSDSILLTVAELTARFNPTTAIPVRRTWLEKVAAAQAIAAVSPAPAAAPTTGDGMPANMAEVAAEVAAETPAPEAVTEEKIQLQVS